LSKILPNNCKFIHGSIRGVFSIGVGLGPAGVCDACLILHKNALNLRSYYFTGKNFLQRKRALRYIHPHTLYMGFTAGLEKKGLF